jgi:YD repeat-containing protein
VTVASKCTYAGTGYANPHAVSQIGNGTATTTYAYDNNGNVTSSGNGTATTTYTYDYANRLTAIIAHRLFIDPEHLGDAPVRGSR